MSQQDMDRDSLRQEIDAKLGWTPNPERAVSWHEAVEAALDVLAPRLESVEASRRDWAAEADRLQHAFDETTRALNAEIAWQKDAYRDGHKNARTEALARGRTIGMEDARRTLTETFARSLLRCAVHPEADR